MKICFASLRKRINYTDVLEYGMDVFYESYRHYVRNNPQHEYTYYNFAFGSKGAVRDNNVIKEADVIIFPAVQEFIYFVQAMHPRDIEKSQSKIRELYDDLNKKDIILMTQDRGVNEELILTKTFEGQVKPKSFQTIDEMDFTCCLQGLKYQFIMNSYRFPVDKDIDFIYWGSDKRKYPNPGNGKAKESGDDRYNIIKSIHKNPEIKSTIIGRWPSGIKVERKWISMKEIVGYLDRSITTLCFNWIDQTALTGRYHESIGCGMYPFVWKDYDTNNILVSDEFQRILTQDEFYDKIGVVKKDRKYFEKVQNDFLNKLPSEDEYYKEFEGVLNKCFKLQ